MAMSIAPSISLAPRLSAKSAGDREVRELLKRHLVDTYLEPDAIVLEELGLCQGDVRIDVASVNGELTGFEIKSPADTLARWPNQCRVYSKVVDRAWIVATDKALEAARVPGWWGVIRVLQTDRQIGLRMIRASERNPSPDPYSIACLLWRDEAIDALAEFRLDRGVRTKDRRVIWQSLADALPLDDLRRAVRAALKVRPQRIAELRAPGT